MAETEQTKVCPLCAETIKAAAKVCPHCHSWQKKWSLQNPRTMQSISAVFALIFIFGTVCGLGYFLDHLIEPKHDFAQYQDQVTVVESETSFHVVDSNLMVAVVGVITNQSPFGWKELGMEAQFFNGDGKLIDVIQEEGEYNGFEIQPRSEAAFRIDRRAIRKEQEYKSTRVFVRTGKDISAWP
jgi:hypothetical protein